MLAINDTGTESRKPNGGCSNLFSRPRNREGHRLGLSTTYGIVKQAKLYLGVQRTRPGTTFRYTCRPNHDVPVEAVSAPFIAPVKMAAETVLLVEDEAACADSEAYLENAASSAGSVNGGRREIIAEHAASIDLGVTDVIMPGAASRAARSTAPSSPCLEGAVHVGLHRENGRA